MALLRRALGLSFVAVLLVVGAASAAGPYPPPQGSGRVDPSRIRVGDCAVFSGDGFLPLTAVAVTDNGTPEGSATADLQGTFSKRLCYGSGTKPGRHRLAGSGTGQDLAPLTVTAVLRIEGVREDASAATLGGGTVSGEGLTVSVARAATGGALPFTGLPAAFVVLAGLVLAFAGSLLLLVLGRRRRVAAL